MINKIFKLLLAASVLVFFIWILNFHLLFLGHLTAINNFIDHSPFISDLNGGSTPVQEIKSKKVYQEIKGDRASVDFIVPKHSSQLDISIKAENPGQEMIYSYRDQDNKSHNLVLQNDYFQNLDWPIKEIDDYAIFYNPEVTEPYNISGLIENKVENIRTYYASEIFNQVLFSEIEKWQSDNYQTEINLPLRGDQGLYVYVSQDGIFDLTINYSQKVLPENKIGDEKLGFGAHLFAQGEDIIFNQNSDEKDDSLRIYKEDLSPGAYHLDFSHDNDITVNTILTHNPFAVKEKMVLNNPSKKINLLTNSSYINFTTVHGSGEQEITVEDQKINIINREISKVEELSLITSIEAQYADFEMQGSSGSLFVPNVYSQKLMDLMLNNSQLDIDELKEEDNNIQYIIFKPSTYFLNNLSQGTEINSFNYTININLANVKLNNNDEFTLNLIIPEKGIKVSEIKAVYYRNFFGYLINYFK